MLVCVGTHSVRPRNQRNAMFLHGRTQFAPTHNNTNRTMPQIRANTRFAPTLLCIFTSYCELKIR